MNRQPNDQTPNCWSLIGLLHWEQFVLLRPFQLAVPGLVEADRLGQVACHSVLAENKHPMTSKKKKTQSIEFDSKIITIYNQISVKGITVLLRHSVAKRVFMQKQNYQETDQYTGKCYFFPLAKGWIKTKCLSHAQLGEWGYVIGDNLVTRPITIWFACYHKLGVTYPAHPPLIFYAWWRFLKNWAL